MQNTHFSGLTRQNPVFERSVLKYVSIKNRILTPSGQKSRVCVNTLDRLLPPDKERTFFCIFPAFPKSPQSPQANFLAISSKSSFRRSPSKAGRGVAFLKLARAKRGRWLVLSEFAKYAFFWPDKAKSCFRAQRTQVREHQKQDFNAVRPKKSGLRKCARQALAPGQKIPLFAFSSSARASLAQRSPSRKAFFCPHLLLGSKT